MEESCDDERRIHALLMDDPRCRVEIDSIKDEDARHNYRTILSFRKRLLDAGTVEGC